MTQNTSVHSTTTDGENIIPGIDDGGAGVGNGSTYQLYRGPEPTGSGTYWGKDKDGNVEPIGGGTGGGSILAEITNSGPSTLVATVTGGTGPYTYLWTVRSNNSGAPTPADPVITSGQGTDTITLQDDGTRRTGLLEVLITDSNGLQDKAYWWSNITSVG